MSSITKYRWVVPPSWVVGQLFLVAALAGAAERPAATSELYAMVLHDGLENRDLEVLIRRQGDHWTTALALTPRWNQSSHEVDFSDLQLADCTLRGTFRVSLHPNATWPTADYVPPVRVKIDARVKRAGLVGQFESLYDGVTSVGRVTGHVRPCDLGLLENSDISVRLEKPTPIEADGWKHEMSLCISLRHGKPTAGRMVVKSSESSLARPVEVDVARVMITGQAITGNVRLSMAGRSAVDVTLRGIVVGEQIGGACDVTIDGQLQPRRMRGEIRPAAGHPPPLVMDPPLSSPSGTSNTKEGERAVLDAKGGTVRPCSELDQTLELARKTLAMVERVAPRPLLAAELQTMERRAELAKELSDAERQELYGSVRR